MKIFFAKLLKKILLFLTYKTRIARIIGPTAIIGTINVSYP